MIWIVLYWLQEHTDAIRLQIAHVLLHLEEVIINEREVHDDKDDERPLRMHDDAVSGNDEERLSEDHPNESEETNIPSAKNLRYKLKVTDKITIDEITIDKIKIKYYLLTVVHFSCKGSTDRMSGSCVQVNDLANCTR